MSEITISAEKLATLLGIPGRINDLWTADYSQSITVTYDDTHGYPVFPAREKDH